jgi:hypothetical protein
MVALHLSSLEWACACFAVGSGLHMGPRGLPVGEPEGAVLSTDLQERQ